MDNPFKLGFFLFFFSSSSFSAWDIHAKYAVPNFHAAARAQYQSNVEKNVYKLLKGQPTTAVFHAPVPYSAPATVSRVVPISKALLGGSARLLATASSWQFQAALLAGEFLIDEYTSSELSADPSLDGQLKNIDKLNEVNSASVYSDWKISYYSGPVLTGSALSTKISQCDSYFTWIPHEGCAVHPSSTSTTMSIWAYGTSSVPQVSYERVPATDSDLFDVLIDPMTDAEFERYLNDPIVSPLIDASPVSQSTALDIASDVALASDSYDGVSPDLSTVPSSNSSYDTALNTFSSPIYDGVPLTTENTDLTSPDYLTTTWSTTETSVKDLVTTTTVTTTTQVTDKNTRDVITTDVQTETTTTTRPDPADYLDPSIPPPEPTVVTTTGESSSSEPSPNQDQVDLCALHPDIVACLDVGTDLPEPPVVPEYEVPFDVQIYSLSSNATCPAPVDFTLLLDGETYSIKYDPICDFASMMKPLIVALGLFLSFTIVGNSIKAGGI